MVELNHFYNYQMHGFVLVPLRQCQHAEKKKAGRPEPPIKLTLMALRYAKLC